MRRDMKIAFGYLSVFQSLYLTRFFCSLSRFISFCAVCAFLG